MRTIAPLILVAFSLAAQQPAPTLQISAHAGREIALPRGWPLLVRGILLPDPSTAAPLRLAPAAVAWSDAIRFEISSAAGGRESWDLKLPGVPDARELTLGSGAYAVVQWFMSAEATANLREDTYELSAILEISGGAGWNGSIRSAPVSIRVIPEPSPLTPAQEVEYARLRMETAVLEGRLEEAEAHIDALLKAQPDGVYGLQAKARLLERQGVIPVALIFALRARAAFREQNPNAPEPPAGLYDLVHRLEAALAADTGGPSARSRGARP